MKEVWTLLKPRIWSFRNGQFSTRAKGRRMRLFLFGSIGLIFWTGIFIAFYRMLTYFKTIEGFGDVLAAKLLSMVVVTFFCLLIFSSVINILSKLYLSHDLPLVHALPVSREEIFLARWLESTVDSSWMVIIYSLPIFLSYGIVYKASLFFYATVGLTMLPLCLIASAMSAIIVLIMAVILPAGRIRTVFIFFGFLLFLILILTLRLMQPERLVNPDAFSSLVLYFRNLETPGSPFLPTTWIIDSIRTTLSGYHGAIKSAVLDLSLIWSFTASLIFVATWISGAIYFPGYSKSQTTPGRLFNTRYNNNAGWTSLLNFLPGPAKAFTIKEIRTFFRDQTQWPQVFLIIALIVVYIFNFSVLPLDKSPIQTVYLQNLFSFLNVGLASFVLTAIAARFVYPAVSLEGKAFWIVQAAPIPIGTFLWIKFFVYYVPLLILAEILIVVTNILLQVTPFMMALSTATVFCMVPGIVSMGIGLGAIYPDFHSENPGQSVTSFGGLLYMVFCAAFVCLVIALEAGPVYAIFMAGLQGHHLSPWQWTGSIGSLCAALTLCFLALFLPMLRGKRCLEDR